MEVFRRNNVRFIAINNGIGSAEPSTLEFAPFINVMSEWYARGISKKMKTGIKTKGTSGKPIAVYLKNEQILTPTFYLKQHDRGTAKSRQLNEENRYNWNKATLTHILTRQEYRGDVVNFKTAKHYRDKHSSYVDKSQWQIIENVHEPIIDRATFENVQRILADAPVKRPNGDGCIHPLSGLLY